MDGQFQSLIWYVATITALVGVVTIGVGWQSNGTRLVVSGGAILTILAIAAAWRRKQRDGMRPVGGIFTLIGGPVVLLIAAGIVSNILPMGVPTNLRVVTLAIGLQALLLIVDARPSEVSRNTQWVVPLLGHGAMLAGSLLALNAGPFEPGAALVAYATGFSSLILHAFWMRQLATGVPPEPDTMTRWEAALLIALITGVIGTSVASFAVPPGELVPPPAVAQPSAVVAGMAAVVGLATLALPPSPPAILEPLTGTLATVLQHGATLIIFLNAFLLAVILVATWVFILLLIAFLAWIALAATIEYLQILYAYHQLNDTPPDPPPLSPDVPITVVISAAFEADVLPRSLSINLEALPGLQFLLVPAAKSDDGTIEIAQKFAVAHNRVRVVKGTSGSKAGDLNQVWSHINTPYALLLDADETIDLNSVARGVQVLREHPDVGVVQGRKAASHPTANAFSRFVSVERQHSTWVDHPFMDDIFGAGHFGGSVAIFRREVPPAADGWDPDALTEDIDFTLRLYNKSDWIVKYIPEMVARESHPATLRALVRQRVRWARGWAQAATRHFRDIFRSRQKLGWRRTLGIEWLLFTAVSAPVYTTFPILMILWFIGFAPPLPLYAAIAFGVFLLPARAASFGYAALRDPEIPFSTTPKRVCEVTVYAYLWVLFGWFVQLHALYLQFSGAPQLWYVTEKSTPE